MKTFIREYGVITALIVCGIVGYVVYDQNRQNILVYSLDAIGERLVAMVDDPATKQVIADRFAQYKRQVLERDVAPEEVEHFAANVLNLSSSGARLTPEEAELVLEDAARLPSIAGSTDPAGAPPGAPAPKAPPAAPRALKTMGERLGAMIVFHREMEEMIAEHPAERKALAEHVRFVADSGLHVAVDPEIADEIALRAGRLGHQVEQMERTRRLVWKKWRQEAPPPAPPSFDREFRIVAELSAAQREAVMRQAKRLEVLTHLEAMGYEPSVDLEALADSLEIHLQALETRLEEVERLRSGAVRAAEGAVQ